MSTFGYRPGFIDYWSFLTDWRNGSIALLFVLVAVLALAFVARQRRRVSPDDGLPKPRKPRHQRQRKGSRFYPFPSARGTAAEIDQKKGSVPDAGAC
jgi:hypothetical protein